MFFCLWAIRQVYKCGVWLWVCGSVQTDCDLWWQVWSYTLKNDVYLGVKGSKPKILLLMELVPYFMADSSPFLGHDSMGIHAENAGYDEWHVGIDEVHCGIDGNRKLVQLCN